MQPKLKRGLAKNVQSKGSPDLPLTCTTQDFEMKFTLLTCNDLYNCVQCSVNTAELLKYH